MDSSIRRGIWEMFGAMAISGTTGYFVLISGQPPLSIVLYRCAFAVPILAVVCWMLGYFRRDLLTPRVMLWAGLGGLAIVSNWILLFAAFPRASISMATAVYQTQPFMLVILGSIFLKEKLDGWKMAWLGLAFAGLLLILQVAPSVVVQPGAYGVGIAMAIGAALLYAVASLIIKRLKGTPPHLIALVQVGVGLVVAGPMVFWQGLPTPVTVASWGSLAALGILHTALVYILLYGAIQKLPTTAVASLSFVYPAVAVGVDLLVLEQSLALVQVAGIILILIAAAGVNLGWKTGLAFARPHKV